MTYRETMEAARQHNINVIKLEVAYELNCLAEAQDPEVKLTEQQFEEACYLIERAYLKSEYLTVGNITQALLNMLEETLKAKKELEKNLMYVLNRYTTKYKDIFWMACIELKPYDEICSITGYSYDAVNKIVHKLKSDIISKFIVVEPAEPKKRKRRKEAL